MVFVLRGAVSATSIISKERRPCCMRGWWVSMCVGFSSCSERDCTPEMILQVGTLSSLSSSPFSVNNTYQLSILMKRGILVL